MVRATITLLSYARATHDPLRVRSSQDPREFREADGPCGDDEVFMFADRKIVGIKVRQLGHLSRKKMVYLIGCCGPKGGGRRTPEGLHRFAIT